MLNTPPAFTEQEILETKAEIAEQLKENPVLIYIKGTPQEPRCGFSAQSVQALMQCGVPFGFVDILDNPHIRAILPQVANWPTFPQLYLKGELVGGCDIILELQQEGELEPMVKAAVS